MIHIGLYACVMIINDIVNRILFQHKMVLNGEDLSIENTRHANTDFDKNPNG